MFTMSRRAVLGSAAAAAAFGLSSNLEFVMPALAATPLEPMVGFYKYTIGDVEVTAIYDGIWKKPHDPTFIKNASIEDTKEALSKAGLTTEFMPIPLTVVVLKLGDRLIMMDAGSGVGQWQANATHLPANMAAAGASKIAVKTARLMPVPRAWQEQTSGGQARRVQATWRVRRKSRRDTALRASRGRRGST